MVRYATFGRRLWAFVLAVLVDLFVFGVLGALGLAGDWLGGALFVWLVIHHVGLVCEGGTFGHRLLGLRVVRVDGTPVPPLLAFVRAIVEPLSLLPLGLGMLWMLDQPRRQTWHDLAASTVVVRELPDVATSAPEWAAAPPWRAKVDGTDASAADTGV